ncbi:pyocin knob domain-containing protein, partial [Ignatzschineria cameli]|uniref:pyocin knob domain-containing protein n=1 Tax=Ignatzschineria cameli TaxID=2182793 RepID=UPI000D60A87D
HAGIYHQTANANALAERHYPVKLAGTLFVLESAGITQLYITYNQGQRIFTRNNYGGKWDKWIELLDTSDILNNLGTSTNKTVSQKVVNDVNTKATTAQKTADGALVKAQNLKDLTNKATARVNLGLGNSAIRNMTSSLGDSKILVASQALVNSVNSKIKINTASKGRNGWWKCGATGVIYQWGTVDYEKYPGEIDVQVKFPIAFNIPLNAQVTRKSLGGYYADAWANLVKIDKTGMLVDLQNEGGGVRDARGFTWFAIGY